MMKNDPLVGAVARHSLPSSLSGLTLLTPPLTEPVPLEPVLRPEWGTSEVDRQY